MAGSCQDGIAEAVWRAVLAACFLRYMDALRIGDNYASPTSCAAWDVAHWYISWADLDRMARMWEWHQPLVYPDGC